MGEGDAMKYDQIGLHILLKLNTVSSFELIEAALQKGVMVYSLKFWLNPTSESDSYIMLGFGGLSIEEIDKGIRLLASCLP
jgi:GntR family transcriptional regulator / MocR family aminotransferase